MSVQCPLCFVRLDDYDELDLFCPDHPAQLTKLFVHSQRKCASPECTAYRRVNGLLVRHEGCEYGAHPFWNNDGYEFSDNIVVDGKKTTISHWLLAALHAAAAHKTKDMWFPASMLLDAGREIGRPKKHALVALVGHKGVGKTFMAMHILDLDDSRAGGAVSERVGRIQGDFIYCYPQARAQGADAEEFLQTLHLRELMQRNNQFSKALKATVPRPRNLKAAFFEYPAPKLEPQDGPLPVQPGPNRSWRRRWLDGPVAAAGKAIRGLGEADGLALLLYDITGEESDATYSAPIHKLSSQVDVLAVMISAQELPGGGANTRKSIQTAHVRLAQAPKDARCCLIVTKADALQDPAALQNGDLEALRGILTGATDTHHRSLLNHLDNRVVQRVFVTRPDQDPDEAESLRIHGLSEFVDWCFSPERP